jgi:hypothetical protein
MMGDASLINRTSVEPHYNGRILGLCHGELDDHFGAAQKIVRMAYKCVLQRLYDGFLEIGLISDCVYGPAGISH